VISDHIINLLPLVEGHVNTSKAEMLDRIATFLALPERKQKEYQLARRMWGVYDHSVMNQVPQQNMEKIYDMAIISDRLSYQCQHLEWLKKEEKKKALEEAKAKEEVNAKAKTKEVNGKESNKADSKTTVKEKSQEDKKTTAKEKSKEDKKEENEQLSFKWS